MKSDNKSINWINAIKAFSIIAVFFAHAQRYYGCSFKMMNAYINPWYVNSFFFVSGYLLFWKQLSEPKILEDRKSYVKMGSGKTLFFNILFRIIIPSILFSFIEFVPSCLIQGRSIGIGYMLLKTVGGGTYWFTSALVVAELILLLLLLTRKRNVWFYATICFLLGIASLAIVKWSLLKTGVWAWRQGLIALVFLAMGGLYWKYESRIDKLMRWWFVLLLLAVYVLVILCCKNTSSIVSTLKIQPLGFLTSAIACLLLVWLCKKLPEVKPLTFIGQNSLGFYFLSGALPITFSLLAHRIMAGNQAWLVPAIWMACLAVAYVAVIIINRWLPWVFDLRLLTRKE